MLVTDSITVLHLSDLHTGLGETIDQDIKDPIHGIASAPPLERLTSYLQSLDTRPQYLAITGDITNRGQAAGWEAFRDWLTTGIDARWLPSHDRIMLVPGNHDAKWGVTDGPKMHAERYAGFASAFATTFPHAYVPDVDPSLNSLSKPGLTPMPIGGVTTVERYGRKVIIASYPFILDLNDDILLFAFNSSLGSGVYKDGNPTVMRGLAALETVYKGDAATVKEIQAAYKDSLLVDAAWVGREQLEYFGGVMSWLRKELGIRYSSLTKIALLHHHISPLWNQQLEVKQFDMVLDAAQLRQALFEYDFDIVLHGHKHTNQISIDHGVLPISSHERVGYMSIVSGGTVGGVPRLSDQQSFKLIQLIGRKGPRKAAVVTEVPLLQTADPKRVIRDKSIDYQLTLADRIPAIHDVPNLKQAVDDHVRNELAPELFQGKAAIRSGGELELPPGDPCLVSEGFRYIFDRVVEEHGQVIYYDLILATEHIGFRQRARVLWMLRDVSSWSKKNGQVGRVKLLIGNLEDTAFSAVTKKGEIRGSIDKMRQVFAPAIDSGFLDIRVLALENHVIDDMRSALTDL